MFYLPELDPNRLKPISDRYQFLGLGKPTNLPEKSPTLSILETTCLKNQIKKTPFEASDFEIKKKKATEDFLGKLQRDRKSDTEFQGYIKENSGFYLDLFAKNKERSKSPCFGGEDSNKTEDKTNEKLHIALKFRNKVIRKIDSMLQGRFSTAEGSKLASGINFIEKMKNSQRKSLKGKEIHSPTVKKPSKFREIAKN
jgi:hypothetical protein